MKILGKPSFSAWLIGILLYLAAAAASVPNGSLTFLSSHLLVGVIVSLGALGVARGIGFLVKPLLASKYWSNAIRAAIAASLVPLFLVAGSNLSWHDTPGGSPGDTEVEDIESALRITALLSYLGLVFCAAHRPAPKLPRPSPEVSQ